MIRATEADRPEVEAFLMAHVATSMFPLSNLARHGMAGGHRLAMNFWIARRDGAVSDVLGVTEEGIIMPQCPTGPWGEVAAVLSGRKLLGLLGHAGQVAAIRHFSQFPDAPALSEVEPAYRLTLAEMRMPDTEGYHLEPITEATRETVTGWRKAYLEEVLPVPGEDTAAKASSDIASYIANDSHRVLMQGGTPVALTGFNATLPQVVQIGGVYTPPEARSRGLARRAVALHLEEARGRGVREALLFAASPQACRAYEALGFTRNGDFAIHVFSEPQVPHV